MLTDLAEHLLVLNIGDITLPKHIVISGSDDGGSVCAWVLEYRGYQYKALAKGPTVQSPAEALEGLLDVTDQMVRAKFEKVFAEFSTKASKVFGNGGMVLEEAMAKGH